jgi:tRNA(Glu) U13 pseudouridine synthase TruD
VRAQRLEISAVLPLYGRKVAGGLEDAAKHENVVFERFGLRRSEFRRYSRGAWRISRVLPEGFSVRPCGDGFVAEFTLASGAYATTLLRELTKSSPDSPSSVPDRTSTQ